MDISEALYVVRKVGRESEVLPNPHYLLPALDPIGGVKRSHDVKPRDLNWFQKVNGNHWVDGFNIR